METIMLKDEYDFRGREMVELEMKNRELLGELEKTNEYISGEANETIELQLERNSDRIQEIKQDLETATLVDNPVSSTIVGIGSIVNILIKNEQTLINEISFQIGGVNTPIKGRYSMNAPLVKQIIGAEKGEIVDAIINGVEREITIEDIR